VLSSLMAIGAVAGALAGACAKPRFSWLGLAAAAIGGGFTLAAVAPGYWSFAAALVVIGLATLIFTNATNSLMQLSTEPTMRGRVMALRIGVALGGTPVGAPIVGWVADHCGPRWALGAGRRRASGFAAAHVAVFAIARAGRRALAVQPSDGWMHTIGPDQGQRREIE
jgi:MFS family permease